MKFLRLENPSSAEFDSLSLGAIPLNRATLNQVDNFFEAQKMLIIEQSGLTGVAFADCVLGHAATTQTVLIKLASIKQIQTSFNQLINREALTTGGYDVTTALSDVLPGNLAMNAQSVNGLYLWLYQMIN